MFHRALAAARDHAAEILLAAAIVLVAVLRTYALHFVRADEHVYNYMSLLVLEGSWPYRDFFLSHPPLHVYLMALVFAVSGYSLAVAKWATTAAAASAAVFLLLTGKRLFGKPEGLGAALLFLFTPQVLDGSADVTGANITVALLVAGTYFTARERHLLGGGLLGGACLSGLYAAPMAVMLAVMLLWRSRGAAARFVASWLTAMLLGSLPFLIVAGQEYVYQVVTYNLLKQAHPTTWLAALSEFFFFNQLPMLGFVAALALSGLRWAVEGRRDGEDANPSGRSWWLRLGRSLDPWRRDFVGATILVGTAVGGYLLFFASLQVFYSYYFLMVVPPMALLTAYTVVDLGRYGWRVLIASNRSPAPRRSKRRRGRQQASAEGGKAPALGPRLVAIFAVLATVVHHGRVRDARLRHAPTERLTFTWQDSPWLGATVNGWIRAGFWEPVRDRRSPPGPITRYLQDESHFARTIDDFVAAVRQQCRPGDRIFGDYYLAPFAASVADCAVAARLVDTNTHRIRAGESTLAEWVDAAEADGLSLIVLRYPGWMVRQPEVRGGLRERFPTVVFTWRDPHVGKVELRRGRRQAPASVVY